MFKHLQFLIALFIGLFYSANAQTVHVVKFDAVQNLLNTDNDTTYVINFWATWCKPCVQELPGFVRIDSAYKNQKVKVILISMDFVKEAKTRLEPFIKQRKIASTVWLLNDPDYNSWIDKVDPSWGGALPATLILGPKKNTRIFRETELSFEEINNFVKPLINK
jgi:thiol-disulfide isomerase/thioredoxin